MGRLYKIYWTVVITIKNEDSESLGKLSFVQNILLKKIWSKLAKTSHIELKSTSMEENWINKKIRNGIGKFT